LEKYRYINTDYHWYDYVEESFKARMKAEGIVVERILFSGFCSQGDGACFEGRLGNPKLYLERNANGAYPMIRMLLELGGELFISCRHRGHYYHEYCTTFSIDHDRFYVLIECPTEFHEEIVEAWDRQLDTELDEFEKNTAEHWRGYMRELYQELRKEYEHLTSDDAVWDTIVANELDEPEEETEDALSNI